MSYLLDADWIIEAARGQPIAARTLQRIEPHRISVSWLTIAEVYEGAYNSVNPDARMILFRNLLSPFRFIGLNDGIASQFAELRALLRRRGEMIAATALHHDFTELTFNVRHFQRIPYLKIYQPA